MSDPAIRTEQLTRRYAERNAVERLDLRVEQGEIFGFLGPNGAGKTTTIAMLLGLVRPSSGRAFLFGHDVQQHPHRALERVGAMIETPALYPYLSGYDNLRVLTRAGGLPTDRIMPVLATVELQDRARDRVRTYSQGMRQRLAIAAALLPDPELIILDEPTNGLDPAGTVEIRELIRGLAAGGRTIFLCSHQLHEVQQVCRRVAILKAGRLLAEGRVAELLRRDGGIRLRVEADAEQAVHLIEALDWVAGVKQNENELLISAPAERSAEINRLLATHNIAVAEIGAHSTSLEEFFLEITGDT
jgi:ABC-type multidrug transport system ATPase subunit